MKCNTRLLSVSYLTRKCVGGLLFCVCRCSSMLESVSSLSSSLISSHAFDSGATHAARPRSDQRWVRGRHLVSSTSLFSVCCIDKLSFNASLTCLKPPHNSCEFKAPWRITWWQRGKCCVQDPADAEWGIRRCAVWVTDVTLCPLFLVFSSSSSSDCPRSSLTAPLQPEFNSFWKDLLTTSSDKCDPLWRHWSWGCEKRWHNWTKYLVPRPVL